MKKFFMNLFGVEATAQNIRGRKSSGVEDAPSYKAWKSKDPNKSASSYD